MKKGLLITILVIIASGLLYYKLYPNEGATRGNRLPTEGPAEKVTIPTGWRTYTSETLKYSISYPDGYLGQSNGDYSLILLKPIMTENVGSANFIYVSVVPKDKYESDGEVYNFNNDDYEKLKGLKVGESVSLAASDQPELAQWFSYKRIEDTLIDGHPTQRFENVKPWEFPPGTKEVRYIFEDSGVIYVLGYYFGGDGLEFTIDPREAFNMILTFKLKK